jgi:hypothetical protein
VTHDVRDDETGAQDFALTDETGAYNGTGTTITLILRDRSGAAVDMTGKVSWLVAASGTVRVLPAAGDLKAERAPYTAAFIVTVAGLTYAFPNKAPDTWHVWK